MSSFSGRPCLHCNRGMINPTRYQEVCNYCKIKRRDEKMKKMRKIRDKDKRRKQKRKSKV